VSQAAILCVDDEPLILESLKEQLRRGFGSQFVYELAEDAREASEVIEFARAKAIKVIIILCDWLMPGVKGDEFLVRVHRKYPDIVKIMLTGQADESAVERARQEASLFRCLRKFWSETELMEAIQAALEKRLC
jgi:CheY-like chemotaxis protein